MKKLLVALVLALAAAMMPSMVWADTDTNVCDDSQISDELKAAAGCVSQNGFDSDTTFMPAAVRIIEIVMAVSGVLAAGILVYGGLMYVLSTGAPDKTRRAQSIIIYALVGMVASAFAFTIVYFVSQNIWG